MSDMSKEACEARVAKMKADAEKYRAGAEARDEKESRQAYMRHITPLDDLYITYDSESQKFCVDAVEFTQILNNYGRLVEDVFDEVDKELAREEYEEERVSFVLPGWGMLVAARENPSPEPKPDDK